MEALNQALFLAINAGPNASGGSVAFFALHVAEWPVFLSMGLIVVLVLRADASQRLMLCQVFATLLLAMLASWTIRACWPQPRPFVVGIGQTLTHHAATASFPSFHATFVFALGIGLLGLSTFRLGGWILLALGALIAWARVYVGVHFPFDMIGAFTVALLAMLVVKGLLRMFSTAWQRQRCRRRA